MCEKEVTTDLDKRIIHLVDDALANIQAAHNTLKDTHIITIATSGTMALDVEKVLPQPDLIFLDVSYEVCSRLKADSGTCEIPVIFLTGKASAEDETRGFENLERFDYIHKTLLTSCGSGARSDAPCVARIPRAIGKEKRKADRLLEKAGRLFGSIFDYAARMDAEAGSRRTSRRHYDRHSSSPLSCSNAG